MTNYYVTQKDGSIKVVKTTTAQHRAYHKLNSTWQSAYDIQESLATLRALVRRGLAESKANLGAVAFPRNSIYFRIKEQKS
jgi:sulfur relay (sulfurtransferase) DsrF/TusC family protein